MPDKPKFEPDKEFAKEMAEVLGISLAEALAAMRVQQEDAKRKKRGGKVSRKRGKKIMQGYKAGGKV